MHKVSVVVGFVLMFATIKSDGQKDLYCVDPHTGLRYPVNSTWPATTFCGTYTCNAKLVPSEDDKGEPSTVAIIDKIIHGEDINKRDRELFRKFINSVVSQKNKAKDPKSKKNELHEDHKQFQGKITEEDYVDLEDIMELYRLADDLLQAFKDNSVTLQNDIRPDGDKLSIDDDFFDDDEEESVVNDENVHSSNHSDCEHKESCFGAVPYSEYGGWPYRYNSTQLALEYSKYLTQYYAQYPDARFAYQPSYYPQYYGNLEQKLEPSIANDIDVSESNLNQVYHGQAGKNEQLVYPQGNPNPDVVKNYYSDEYYKFWKNGGSNIDENSYKNSPYPVYTQNANYKSNPYYAPAESSYQLNRNNPSGADYNNPSFPNNYKHVYGAVPSMNEYYNSANALKPDAPVTISLDPPKKEEPKEEQKPSNYESDTSSDDKAPKTSNKYEYYIYNYDDPSKNVVKNTSRVSYYFYDPVKKEYTLQIPQNYSQYEEYYKEYLAQQSNTTSTNPSKSDSASSDDDINSYYSRYYSQFISKPQGDNAPEASYSVDNYDYYNTAANVDEVNEYDENYGSEYDETYGNTPALQNDVHFKLVQQNSDESEKYQDFPTYEYKVVSESPERADRTSDWSSLRLAEDRFKLKPNPLSALNRLNRLKEPLVNGVQFSDDEVSPKLAKMADKLAQFGPFLAPRPLKTFTPLKARSFLGHSIAKRGVKELKDAKTRAKRYVAYVTVEGCPESVEPGMFRNGDPNQRFPKCCPQKI